MWNLQQSRPGIFRRAFEARAEAAGVPVVALHSTRKACASLLVARDIHPRVAMAILRHSQIAVTMDIYSQVASASTSEVVTVCEVVVSAGVGSTPPASQQLGR